MTTVHLNIAFVFSRNDNIIYQRRSNQQLIKTNMNNFKLFTYNILYIDVNTFYERLVVK